MNLCYYLILLILHDGLLADQVLLLISFSHSPADYRQFTQETVKTTDV